MDINSSSISSPTSEGCVHDVWGRYSAESRLKKAEKKLQKVEAKLQKYSEENKQRALYHIEHQTPEKYLAPRTRKLVQEIKLEQREAQQQDVTAKHDQETQTNSKDYRVNRKQK